MKPLISVIIPVYNSEKYLSQCLESLLSQNYSNLQVITVDDGSTDQSGIILDQYALKDTRIKVYHGQNNGVSAARNIGLSHAKGEFITFVDSDDTIEKNMYDDMVQQFYENDVDIVHCGYKKIKLDGACKMVSGTNKKYCFNKNEGMMHFLLGDLFTGSPCTKLYRKSVLRSISFDETIKINEDVLFNFYAFQKANRTIFIDKPFYCYYERENGSTKRVRNSKKSSDCMQVAKIMYTESRGKVYEMLARSKYVMTLMNQYRALIYKSVVDTKNERKKIQNLLNELLKGENNVKKKYIDSYRFMVKMPRVYMCLYNVYDKIRKPNWDV